VQAKVFEMRPGSNRAGAAGVPQPVTNTKNRRRPGVSDAPQLKWFQFVETSKRKGVTQEVPVTLGCLLQ